MSVLSSRADLTAIPLDAVQQLADALGKDVEVTTRALDRVSVAVDASHYLKTPQALARPRNASQVGMAMAIAIKSGWPLTLRGGGTSLSGQAMSEGLTVDVRRHFRNIEVLEGGKKVRVEPGLTIRQVNNYLARYKRKLGPDPASEIACTIGGMIANNSSGMTCGTTANAYRTIDSMVIVLPSGTVIDTSVPDADVYLRQAEPHLVDTLLTLRDQLRRPEMQQDIKRRYSIKNTMGYGMNSFLDFDSPVKILEHLMIGSEGTLGFVAQAVFNTVPIHDKTATGFLLFNSLDAATDALPVLVESGAGVVELLDSASIAAMGKEGESVLPKGFALGQQAMLLVEYQGDTEEELREVSQRGYDKFSSFDLYADAEMTQDKARRAQMWTMRNGLYTKVMGNRPKGTVALLEDVAVPMKRLGSVCQDLQVLFDRHNYDGAVIFGHAKDGNIHFLVTEDFDGPASMKRYEDFTEDMVQLILGEQGTLKAEHGTGRIMAPFVRRQYGDELYDAMWQIKKACDPTLTLNPGAVLTEDPKLHLKNIKVTSPVREVLDDCVECGYCEPVCPSQHLTTTPRQRIVIQRAIDKARAEGNQQLVSELQKQQEYSVIQTCAVDSMCQTACPMKIDTGQLVRELREEGNCPGTQAAWATAAKVWGPFTQVAATGMSARKFLPTSVVTGVTQVARKVAGADNVPLLSADLPKGGQVRQPLSEAAPDAVFMPACIGTMFGGSDRCGDEGVQNAVVELARFAGIKIRIPEGIAGLCCGAPWKSKGLSKGQEVMSAKLVEQLGRASDNWKLPIICDNASCTEAVQVSLEKAGVTQAKIVDAMEYVAYEVAPKLPELPKVPLAVVHPTCSSTRMGINDSLTKLAGLVAKEVRVPEQWRCCAFAGDRGMLHPELTATATREEAALAKASNAQLYLSCNRTCEIGMSRATGQTYEHVLVELARRLLEVSRKTGK